MKVIIKKSAGVSIAIEHQGNKMIRFEIGKEAKDGEPHCPYYTVDINRDELNKALDFIMGGCGCGTI